MTRGASKTIHSARRLPKRAAGFTLIEVVLAMSIMVFVFGVMYASLEQLMRTKGYLDDERDLGALANSILNRMTRELQLITNQEHLMPPRDNLSKRYGNNVDLIGTKDSITFIANDGGQYVEGGMQHTGMVQITYRTAEDPEGGSGEDRTGLFIRDEVPYSSDYENAYKKIMTFPVSRNLVSLAFAYYDGEKQAWFAEWDETQRTLPRLIRFTVKIRSPAGGIRTFSTIVPIGLGDASSGGSGMGM